MDTLRDVVVIISGTINCLHDALSFIIELSAITGQILVILIVSVLDHLWQFFNVITEFLTILYEDWNIFVQDVIDKLSYFYGFMGSGIEGIEQGLVNISSGVTTYVTSTVSVLNNLVKDLGTALLSSVALLQATISLIWDSFLLLGASVWMAVTKTPHGLFHCVLLVSEKFQDLLHETLLLCLLVKNFITESIHNVFLFMYDVPYSSVLGSVLALLSISCACKNYKAILSMTYHLLFASCRYISSTIHNLWTGNLFTRQPDSCGEHFNQKLCIICMERMKEVMLLPCKHVCLCVNCSVNIRRRNHRSCPLCRSHIQTTMRVYI